MTSDQDAPDISLLLDAAIEQVNDRDTISCTKAFAIAQTAGVSAEDVGRLCHQRKIKILNCQLGCF